MRSRNETEVLWRFRVFASLWAIATLFHIAHVSSEALPEPWLAIPAALLLGCSGSVVALVGFAGVQIVVIGFALPKISNHWFFTLLIAIAIVVGWLHRAASTRSLPCDA